MCINPQKNRSEIILDWLKVHPEAADMNFNQLHEEINKEAPFDRANLAVTVSLLSLTDKVLVKKDEQGRGLGFSLPKEVAPTP